MIADGKPAVDCKTGFDDVVAILPALDEADNVGDVVDRLKQCGIVDIVVVDNGSSDATASVARSAGATIVYEPERGYGRACAVGSERALALGASILVYIDADGSSRPEEISRLLEPIRTGAADLVLGSRFLGPIARDAMPAHQQLGNRMLAAGLRRLYGVSVTDLAPYRAVTADLYTHIEMTEMTFGWPIEMIIKAAELDATIAEVSTTWDPRRHGESKVGGSVRGSLLAAANLMNVMLRHKLRTK